MDYYGLYNENSFIGSSINSTTADIGTFNTENLNITDGLILPFVTPSRILQTDGACNVIGSNTLNNVVLTGNTKLNDLTANQLLKLDADKYIVNDTSDYIDSSELTTALADYAEKATINNSKVVFSDASGLLTTEDIPTTSTFNDISCSTINSSAINSTNIVDDGLTTAYVKLGSDFSIRSFAGGKPLFSSSDGNKNIVETVPAGTIDFSSNDLSCYRLAVVNTSPSLPVFTDASGWMQTTTVPATCAYNALTCTNMTDSSLSASSGVYTNGSKQLTSTAPSSLSFNSISTTGTTDSSLTASAMVFTNGSKQLVSTVPASLRFYDILPYGTTNNLGSGTAYWDSLFLSKIYAKTNVLLVEGDIVGSLDGYFSLGTSSTKFSKLYTASITDSSTAVTISNPTTISSTLNMSGLTASTLAQLDSSKNVVGSNTISSTINMSALTASTMLQLNSSKDIVSSNTISQALTLSNTLNCRDVIPTSNAVYDLGSNSLSFDNVFCRGLRSNNGDTITCENFQAAANNTYTIGNTSVRYAQIWCNNALNSTSDLKLKKDIYDSDLGLDFIDKLRPVKYKFIVGQYTAIKNENGEIVDRVPEPGRRFHYGLIAQEIEQTLLNDFNKTGEDFAGLCVDNVPTAEDPNNKEYTLRYTELISPMIKAIQELKQQIDDLKNEINILKST